uniref:Transmembrane protein n=1 Tax=Strombidium inclinatum TaxID=197538 RepID=A0A7S3MVQ8_9SPIT|mmetsp:Transcript_1221/g.1393  ORF Transcript_1221/g.1393 Transcript_1221/m.1393 type:complete len:152 (+) Transcript_1221:30-485(+)
MLNWTTNVNKGDLGYIFRMQGERSLDQLDRLIQLKYHYAKQLDEEKVKEIEADVTLFADADQFRIYHAKGRFRGFFFSAFTTAAAFTVMNGGKNGYGAMRRHPLMAMGVFVGNYIVFYQIFSRYAGYNSQKFNEFQYARVHKMLRNAQVKQ